ncbi:MAG TPA: type II toxin-antitoxin system HicB family antitoxin [Planctomycetaceae bacterium]|nr:type II toxin-antitoxin system HicB family antitoxin [Planctomycetaceae bacterium]
MLLIRRRSAHAGTALRRVGSRPVAMLVCSQLMESDLWEVCGVRYRVIIEQDEDGVYIAEVPALPGCISQGHTRSEALDNIREAIAAYVESLQAHGEPVPPSIFEEVVEVDL